MPVQDALAIVQFGQVRPVAGSDSRYEVPESLMLLQQRGNLSFELESNQISRITFSFETSGFTAAALEPASQFVDRVATLIEPEVRERFRAFAKMQLDGFALKGAASPAASIQVHLGLTLRFAPTDQGRVTCQLVGEDLASLTNRIGISRRLPPTGLPTDVPPQEIPPRTLPIPAGNVPTLISSTPWPVRIPGSAEKTFQRSIGSIHSLLVREIEGGKHAAAAMKLTITAIPDRDDGTIDFAFNQDVGDDMRKATHEVVRAALLRHQSLPQNHAVRFGFADKWSGKDGPSAAVACALLVESLLQGFEIPEVLAVTGDLNADSTVQPVGGVADKIRGAMDKGCTLIGIPAANEPDILDLVVEENLRRFLTARVFTLATLDDALALADPLRLDPVKLQALAELDAVQKVLAANGAALYQPETGQRLASIRSALPNCFTARILEAAARRSVPVRYSLAGTLVRIDEAMSPFTDSIRQIKEGTPLEEFRLGRNDPIQEAKNRLAALRTKSDERLVPVIDAQKGLVDAFQRMVNDDLRSKTVFQNNLAELEKAETRADEAWKRVRENRQIQDELMKRGISID